MCQERFLLLKQPAVSKQLREDNHEQKHAQPEAHKERSCDQDMLKICHRSCIRVSSQTIPCGCDVKICDRRRGHTLIERLLNIALEIRPSLAIAFQSSQCILDIQ
jgi:polyferredoxin